MAVINKTVKQRRAQQIALAFRSDKMKIAATAAGTTRAFQGNAYNGGVMYPTLIIGEDRNLIGVQTNGKRETIGTWELDRTALRVTPTPARFETARKSGYHLNGWDYYPVIYTDAHELVMTPGISVAGRWRYKR